MHINKNIMGIFIALFVINVNAAVSTFESVTETNEQSYGGPGGGRYWSGLVPPPSGTINSSFMSGAASFLNTNNECCGGITFWSGFAYSNTTDTQTAGFGNQYSAFPGGGAQGSSNYAVSFGAGARIEFAEATLIESAMITNTTYAAISMRDGDGMNGPGKKFGGENGTDEDFFELLITGLDQFDNEVGSLTFALADFRFADSDDDYIVDDWQAVNLMSLGAVHTLSFSYSSSDVGGFGINTPTYFALDNLTVVPLPGAFYLLLGAIGALFRFRRSA